MFKDILYYIAFIICLIIELPIVIIICTIIGVGYFLILYIDLL